MYFGGGWMVRRGRKGGVKDGSGGMKFLAQVLGKGGEQPICMILQWHRIIEVI